MNADRTQLWGVELPIEASDAPVVVITTRGSTFVGVAVDVLDDIEEGPAQIMLTPAEARELYAALGDALAREGVA